jgi:hypothetical protein
MIPPCRATRADAQVTQFRCRRVRPKTWTTPLEADGGGQIAHDHRLAAGIAHQFRGNPDGAGIVPGEGNPQLAALPAGRRCDRHGIDGAEGLYQPRARKVFRRGLADAIGLRFAHQRLVAGRPARGPGGPAARPDRGGRRTDARICPHCHQGRLIFIRRLERGQAMGP